MPDNKAKGSCQSTLAEQAARILDQLGEEPLLAFLREHSGEEPAQPPPPFNGSMLLQDGTMVSVLEGRYRFEDQARMELPANGVKTSATAEKLAQVFHRRVALADGCSTETNVWAQALHQLQPHHNRDRRAAQSEEQSYRLTQSLRGLVRRHSAEYDHTNNAVDELVADLAETGRAIADELPEEEAQRLRQAIRDSSQK